MISRGGNIKGTKKFTYGAYRFNKKVMSDLSNAVGKGSKISMEEFAPILLKYIADTEPGFNSYTGNLENSYVANVFNGRQLVKTIYHDTGIHGVIHTNSSGARWVKLTKRRHGRRTKETFIISPGEKFSQISNTAKLRGYRYLKKWENERGYRRRNYHRGTRYSAANYGSPYAQSFIIIENQAPYAQWVQQNSKGIHRHYNVLRQAAVIKTIMPKGSALVKAFTRQELKKARFDIR